MCGAGLVALGIALLLSAGFAHASDNSEIVKREAKSWIERRLLEHDMKVVSFKSDVAVVRDKNMPDAWNATADVSVIMPTGQKEKHEAYVSLFEMCSEELRSLCWWGGEAWLDGRPLQSEQFDKEHEEIRRQQENANNANKPPPPNLMPPDEEDDQTAVSDLNDGADKNKHLRKAAKYWIEKRLLESNTEGFGFLFIDFLLIKKIRFPNRAEVRLLDSASVPGVWQVSALVLVNGPAISEKERRVTIKLKEACAEVAEPRCWQAGPVWLDERKRPSVEYLGELRRIAEGQIPALSKLPNWALANALGTLRASRNHDFTRHAIREAELLMRRRLRESTADEVEFIGPLTVELSYDRGNIWDADTWLWMTAVGGSRKRFRASISLAWLNNCVGFNNPQCWVGTQIFLNDIRVPSPELDSAREREEEENF